MVSATLSPIAVTEVARVPAKFIPETRYLTAINPDRPADNTTHLMVALENRNGATMLLDLTTNDDSFGFVVKVKNALEGNWLIADSWSPDEPF